MVAICLYLITALSHFSVKFRVKRMILTIHYFSQRNLEGKKWSMKRLIRDCTPALTKKVTVLQLLK